MGRCGKCKKKLPEFNFCFKSCCAAGLCKACISDKIFPTPFIGEWADRPTYPATKEGK